MASREQRKEAWERSQRERRKQASFVSGWAVSTDSEDYVGPTTVVTDGTRIQYNVLNGSDGPLSDVVVFAPNDGRRRINIDFGLMLPGSERSKEQPDTSDRRSLDFYAPHPVPIFFTDTQGIRWFRDGRGALFEWSDQVSPRLSEPWAIIEPEGDQAEMWDK